MKKYLITYDLKDTPIEAYSSLHSEIKKLSGRWWHYLESTWIIKTDSLTANTIKDRLQMYMRPGDRLFVVQIDNNDRQGWLPKEAWDWLKS